MDWNPKAPSQWDWESVALFNAKAGDNPKQVLPTAWGIENGSVYSSGGGGCSGFDMGNGCSSKSSLSVSIGAGPRAVVIDFEAVSKGPDKKKELGRIEHTGTSKGLVAASIGSVEPLIGLKLGKRTYFEDVSTENNGKNISFPAISAAPSSTAAKKSRVSHQSTQSSHCQVEGCNVDLKSAKDYHRKHKVCESHSKCPKVIVAGKERRFCQQCSRFHDLSEFDQKKRSCRRRLSDHNARRRKPPADTIPFNSSRISVSFFDDRQQMNVLLNQSPFGHVRPMSSTWENSCDFKFPPVKGSWTTSTKEEGISGQLHLPTSELPMTVSTVRHDLDRLLPFKGTTAEVLNQGLEASAIASNLGGAPDLRRALSLLSTDSWGAADPGPTSSINQLVHVNHPSSTRPAMHVEHTSTGYWQAEQHLAQEPRVLPYTSHGNGSQFQEFQLLQAPYENTFFNANNVD